MAAREAVPPPRDTVRGGGCAGGGVMGGGMNEYRRGSVKKEVRGALRDS